MTKRSKNKTKNKKLKAVDVYPKSPIYFKSNPLSGHISFTTHTQPIITKTPPKNLDIIQKRKDKKERDTTISIKKQKELAKLQETITSKWESFLKYFA